MRAVDMPPGTVVAAERWVAIKITCHQDDISAWRIAGHDVSGATDDDIDLLIDHGRASVLRIGDAGEPTPETQEKPGILALISRVDGIIRYLVINGSQYPIPASSRRIRPGSHLGLIRVVEALEDAGYRPAGGDYRRALAGDDGIYVEPISDHQNVPVALAKS